MSFAAAFRQLGHRNYRRSALCSLGKVSVQCIASQKRDGGSGGGGGICSVYSLSEERWRSWWWYMLLQ